jgi:hypothetical protein
MKLDDAQKQKVSGWIEEGLKLSEIQDKLNSELGLRMTYMEVRFLIDDLGVKLKDKPQEQPPEPPASKPLSATPPGAPGPTPLSDSEADSAQPPSKVSVTVDQVTRPGALVSGKVTFSDGKGAEWYLDQMGRLGLAPKEQGYKPTQEDLMDFQMELQNELARLGL